MVEHPLVPLKGSEGQIQDQQLQPLNFFSLSSTIGNCSRWVRNFRPIVAILTPRGHNVMGPIDFGVFAQHAHSANCYVVYPRNTPDNQPPIEACMINSKQHGMRNSGPWDPWLPVVENSQFFAQRMVRPVCIQCPSPQATPANWLEA